MTFEGLAKSKAELIEKLKHAVIDSKEDKPKIRNRCGDCAAFHTSFCTWEETNPDRPPYKRAPILRSDVACSRFYPAYRRPGKRETKVSFARKVENL